AGAGYGDGATLQARADDIYNEMVANFGTGGGWTDTAISWWLGSVHNTWPANPYTVVTVYGNKTPKFPWFNPNGARFIGNELRRCQFLGLSISWPIAGASVGTGGHAITCWGDSTSSDSPLATNPGGVRVTDSDSDTGGDVQAYSYDNFAAPNPGGPTEGSGWYFNYSANHPYVKHIITLCPTDDPTDNVLTQKVVGSYRIHQSDEEKKATDLHYKVGSDAQILTYKTSISWLTGNSPHITEGPDPRKELTVDWDLTDNPVPYCTWVTITTEFILPYYNAIKYRDVYFTYPADGTGKKYPAIAWTMDTAKLSKAKPELIPDVTGGYVLGSFDIVRYDAAGKMKKVAGYRLQHQYSYNQNPESHVLRIKGLGPNSDLYIVNLNFGHSYGYVAPKDMWEQKKWMTKHPDKKFALKDNISVDINWQGRLPYPKGENYRGKPPRETNDIVK
ncbi:MAG: hypothetical protein GY950_11900, partial [bacterium]|nr:hypothetical protein [bacterium]